MARLGLSLVACVVILMGIESCTSGKKAYQQGNYFDAVITSTNRLRRDPNHKKSIETLREAYPMSVAYFDDRAKAAIATNAEFKWNMVVDAYTSINVMYDEIKRSPGALKVIPNPVNYYGKLEDAKRNAAEEKYAAGLVAMEANNREKAKLAYRYFKDADAFVPGYKDVINMMEAALWAATLKVVMDPIPVQARNISVSAEFFDNKVSEYLHTASVNEFVKFYTKVEAQNLKLTPDHEVKIEFDEFTVGQVFMHEREVKLQNDSVVVGTYIAPAGSGVVEKPSDTPGEKGKEVPPTDKGPGIVKDPVDKKEEVVEEKKPAEGTPVDKKEEKAEENKEEKKPDPAEFPPDEKIDEKDQVTICHIPQGNEASKHTLVISRSALKAHLVHGDTEGACESPKEKGNPADQKPKDPKANDKKSGNGKGDDSQASVYAASPLLLASASSMNWLTYLEFPAYDTVKVYGTVKATLYHYRKTTTSKGVLSFKILDAKTGAVLSAEKMPGEFIWISEWATFNGDERALTQQQLQWSKQKEMLPPQPQELFIEFTRPIYDQLTTKIADFYKRY